MSKWMTVLALAIEEVCAEQPSMWVSTQVSQEASGASNVKEFNVYKLILCLIFDILDLYVSKSIQFFDCNFLINPIKGKSLNSNVKNVWLTIFRVLQQ